MDKRLYIYILIKLLSMRNPLLILDLNMILLLKVKFIAKTYKQIFDKFLINDLKKQQLVFQKKPVIFGNLLMLEKMIRDVTTSTSSAYFLTITNHERDVNIVNNYLGNFNEFTDIEQLLYKRKFTFINTPKINNEIPSLLICLDPLKHLTIMSSLKNLKIPFIGIVGEDMPSSPYNVTVTVPVLSVFFKIYYFFIIFKLISYYKKNYLKTLIYNYTNFKLIYFRKLWLLK